MRFVPLPGGRGYVFSGIRIYNLSILGAGIIMQINTICRADILRPDPANNTLYKDGETEWRCLILKSEGMSREG